MDQIGFYFLGHLVTYYGLMIVCGILVNIPIIYVQVKRFRLVMNNCIIICAVSGLFGIFGAKILYLVTSFQYIDLTKLNELSYINSLMSGGFVFLGGVIGVLGAMRFCERCLKISVRPYIQACIGCLPIGHAFGRIGCLLVGCCYGIPYNGLFSIMYHHSPFAPNGIALFPVQLVEAIFECMLGCIILIFSKKLKNNFGFYLYLLMYSLFRFFGEFLRYDEIRNAIAGFSTSQILCVLLFIISFCYIIRDLKKGLADHKNNKQTAPSLF